MQPEITEFPDFISEFTSIDLPASGGNLNVLAGSKGQVAFIRSCKEEKIPLHRHKDSWTILVSGKMRVTVGDEIITVTKGDTWFVPGGTLHGGEALEDSLIVEVFSEQRFDIKD